MLSQAIGDLLPSAIGVALSPVPIIAVVLMLGTPRARSNGPAFAVGWVLGLVIVNAVVLTAASGADDSSSAASSGSNTAQVAFGLLFFALAAKQWRNRPARGEAAPMPAWMATLDAFTAGRSFVMGVLLSGINPKNLALTAASAASIAQVGLDSSQTVVAVAVFVVIASLTVAGPVLAFLVAGERADAPLASLKEFMADNVAVIMTVLFLVLGAKMLGAGWAGLSA